MNLWEGNLTTKNQDLIFQSNGMILPVPKGLLPPRTDQESPLTLGIRPEDIALQEEPGSIHVEAQVELVEDLGADLLLHCRIGDLRLVVRADRGIESTAGMAVSLFFPRAKLHIFSDSRRYDAVDAPPT